MLFGQLFGSAEVRELFTDRATVDSWLRAEAALARAQAEVGEIPIEAAKRIEREARVEHFDLTALGDGIARTSHPLMPLIRALAARCGDAGGWVHWGATTQDIVDTGLVLQVLPAIDLIDASLIAATRRAVQLAREHENTVMPGRTHGQHAVPITFGFKAAVWADELLRAHARLQRARNGIACGQLSGAAGTLAALSERGGAIRRAFCRRLGLQTPDIVWHSSRDRIRDLAHALSEIANAAERIGGEVVRHQATELGELSEAVGPEHVGSSTMPHKRNPVGSEYMIAAARMVRSSASALGTATVHAFERDMSAWAVEWLALPQAMILAGGVAARLASILTGLEVHPDRMRANVAMTRGAIMSEAGMMAAAKRLGRERAHELMTIAARQAAAADEDLIDALGAHADQHLAVPELERLRDPATHLGAVREAVIAIQEAAERALPETESSHAI